MGKEETVERLKKKFLDKDLKDEVMVVLVALFTDIPEAKVEKYMTTDLNADQLVEMMVAIMDGLPESSLETLSKGKTSAEDMRALRLMSRGDSMLQLMTGQINDLKELIEKVYSNTGQEKILKGVREMKSEIASVRGCVESIEERLNNEATADVKEMKKEMEQKKAEKVTEDVVPEKVENDPQAMAARLSAYQTQMVKKEAKDADEAAEVPEKPIDYILRDGMVISRESLPETNKRSILSIFRKVNEGKVGAVSSELEKRKAINKIVALGLEEDKLKALSVGARAGVDPETLKRFAQRGSSASQIYGYINIFGALFIEDFKPIAAGA